MLGENPYQAPRKNSAPAHAGNVEESIEFKKLRKEVRVFAFGIGLLMAGGGAAMMNSLQGAPTIFAMPRGLVLGTPLLGFGLLCLASGVALVRQLSVRSLHFFVAAMFGTLLYAVYFQAVTGVILINLGILLVYIIPFLALSRAGKLTALLRKRSDPEVSDASAL